MTEKRAWIYDLLFIAVLLLAGTLRFTGVEWGEGYHQHPDELFLSGVLDSLRAQTCEDPSLSVDACPPEQKRWLSIGEYFDTAASTLNPYNRGYGFFVYGNLPMTLVRAAIEWSGSDDIGQSKFFARQASAAADLLTIFLLYLLVSKMYGRKVGLFASVFSALAVMQIQQSHFFTVDLFVNLFMFAAIYFAVAILNRTGDDPQIGEGSLSNELLRILREPLFLLSIAFGAALGMAMASKINAAVMAILLPGAFIVRYLAGKKAISSEAFKFIVICLAAGGIATILSFRIFQPYAFDGLGFNPQWTANISEQRAQASGEADLPWNLQWARRNHLYSFTNLTVWGLGLPLGILAWAGFVLMGWRIFRGEWRHLLLWGWTAFYFGWQSMQFNPTMRYQLPVYPLLAMMAAWFIFELASWKPPVKRFNPAPALAIATGIIVLGATAVWAFAFHGIYLRDETRMSASRWIFENVPGPINLRILQADGSSRNQPLTFPGGGTIETGIPYTTTIIPQWDGNLDGVVLAYAFDSAARPVTLQVSIANPQSPEIILTSATAKLDTSTSKDLRGERVEFAFDPPLPVKDGESYLLKLETFGQTLTLTGSSIANETDYDWGLPFRVDGYDPFGGMYRGDLNLQVYWDDNADKLTRFVDTLNQADYIFIPTNHQYAQITRLPERYPLTTQYYRELLGCPAEEEIIPCYRNAQPGQYSGNLGFELAAIFESYPTLGPLVINDQAAEEAFTFYDHPKVMIFRKSADFDPAKVYAVLGSVDLNNVVHLTPKQAANYKDLMLPEARLALQRAGGTWSQLFDYDWPQNQTPLLGMLLWYGFIFILGLSAYPLVRLALPGLKHYAYPLGRIAGLALLAWISWMGGSTGIPYTRTSIALAFALITALGIGLWIARRDQFKAEWDSQRSFFTTIEILFLIFFLVDLFIRFGNPDMWHPAKGGERPMDFSYFNAVIKSTSFPPYDPWFAGGYINYYYYGFVLAGTPVKLLGIVPSIAYNFILPTWYAMVALGAFTAAYALTAGDEEHEGVHPSALVAGLAASSLAVLLGNLGTLQLVFQALQRMAAPADVILADASLPQRWLWALQGLVSLAGDASLPIGRGEWYWNPSRVIPPGPGNEITEFPLFTFLYSDLHAHMLVMPLNLFIVAWAVSFIKSRAQMRPSEWIAAFGLGALVVGALKPTNTWDLYTFFPLAALAMVYAINRHFDWKERFRLPDWLGRALFSIGAVIGLFVLGSLMYAPFTSWYSQAYNSVDPWTASHTPLSSYFTQWGLFLFVITAWLIWETRERMAATPVSHLGRLNQYAIVLEVGLGFAAALLAFFAFKGARIAWAALPLAVWAALLLLRPNQPGVKRAVLFMIGTGLALTMAVEVITLRGDLGRMNTVFKLYMQAWMLFTVSAGAAFGWLYNIFPGWTLRWRSIYQGGLYVLAAGAFMFTITASADKISDRMNVDAPHTLDSMDYMKSSQHWDVQMMDLSGDYRAIRWLQDNVQGSPVIVEANCSEYRWCTRMTIYTGLPGVIGWNFHQRQQRALIPPNLITDRIDEIANFYSGGDLTFAQQFLRKYQVRYFIVGQLERNIYLPADGSFDGLVKFETFDGQYWKSVYRDKNTVIYEVLP